MQAGEFLGIAEVFGSDGFVEGFGIDFVIRHAPVARVRAWRAAAIIGGVLSRIIRLVLALALGAVFGFAHAVFELLGGILGALGVGAFGGLLLGLAFLLLGIA